MRNCATFGSQSKLHEQCYSFDVVNSAEARVRWISPDLRRLTIPFPISVKRFGLLTCS